MSLVRRLSLLLLLILAANACNWFHPQPLSESDRRELAVRFKNVVTDAGGAQIWIKPPTKLHHGQSPADMSLQVLATPAAYHAVLSRVQQESDKDKLDLGTSAANAGGGWQAVNLNVMQRGQRIIQIHLREVPRLLRAAIVIDDMGRDLAAAHKLLALDYPLTFSVLPYLRYTQTTAQEVHRSGHEVMLHLPMEPEPSAHTSPGEGAVLVGMNAAEVQRVVLNDLASVPYVAGVNNHMGSRATKDAALMADVMKILADHQLYFIDSRTTAASMALEAARRQRLPAFYRAVFLDDTETVPYTLGQLREFRHRVEQQGVALAIGHPHATTIAALAKFLPELERADIELVAPSQIVCLPELARLHPPGSTK
ncbi:MAG: divergent polysaccharide deacetylase family protein [Terriglobia bacterium]